MQLDNSRHTARVRTLFTYLNGNRSFRRSTDSSRPYHGHMTNIWEEYAIKAIRQVVKPANIRPRRRPILVLMVYLHHSGNHDIWCRLRAYLLHVPNKLMQRSALSLHVIYLCILIPNISNNALVSQFVPCLIQLEASQTRVIAYPSCSIALQPPLSGLLSISSHRTCPSATCVVPTVSFPGNPNLNAVVPDKRTE